MVETYLFMIGGFSLNIYYTAVNWKIYEVSTAQVVEELAYSTSGRGMLDDRHNIFSVDNDMDVEGYYNYIFEINKLAQKYGKSKYQYMLELGYMPVIMPPFPYGTILHERFLPRLEHFKVPYEALQASSFTKVQYSNVQPDIWVSKMEAAKLLKMKPTDVTVKTFLEEIK